MLLGTQLKDGVVMSIVSGSDYPIFMYFCYILKSDSKSAIIYMNKIWSLCEANIILASQPWTNFSSAPSAHLNLRVFDAFVLDPETKHKCNKIAMGLTKSTMPVTNITPHLLSPSVCGGGRGCPLPQASSSPILKADLQRSARLTAFIPRAPISSLSSESKFQTVQQREGRKYSARS